MGEQPVASEGQFNRLECDEVAIFEWSRTAENHAEQFILAKTGMGRVGFEPTKA